MSDVEHYSDLKRLRLCVDCKAGLDDPRVRCVECRERVARSDAERNRAGLRKNNLSRGYEARRLELAVRTPPLPIASHCLVPSSTEMDRLR